MLQLEGPLMEHNRQLTTETAAQPTCTSPRHIVSVPSWTAVALSECPIGAYMELKGAENSQKILYLSLKRIVVAWRSMESAGRDHA